MSKLALVLLAAVIGGFAAVGAIVFWFGWGVPTEGQPTFLNPTRGDYVDLLLTLTVLFISAIGVAVTVGALVIGLVALKTLREIKEEAAGDAKQAAADKIQEIGHDILIDMARKGELDEILERVAARMQGGGPEYISDDEEQG